MHRSSGLFIIVLIGTIIFQTTGMVASKTPFRVATAKYKVDRSSNTSQVEMKAGRTRPKFFENVLGIKSGQPFQFPLDKWRAIQQSDLFYNISGRTFQAEDGIAMEVTAFEYPSLSIKPELSMGLSPSNPDVSGGILIRDRNFRGLGEKVEFMISKKEGTEEGVGSMRPMIRFKWGDNAIGKTSLFHITVQREQDMGNWANFCPEEDTEKTDYTFFQRRVPITTKSINFHVEKFTEKIRFGMEIYCKKLKASWIDMDEIPLVKHKTNTIVSGGKVSFNLQEQSGSVSGHLDYGSSLGSYQGRFIQWGCHAETSPFRVPGISFPWLQRNNIDESESYLTAICKLNAVGSDGDGSVPSLHMFSGANTHLVRGFPVGQRSLCNRLTSILSTQIDTFLPALSFGGRLGLFTDFGLISTVDSEGFHPLVTTGLSVRAAGFKVEVASPVNLPMAPRLHFGLDS